MFCEKCGAETAEGSKFCEKCGAALATEPSGKKTGLIAVLLILLAALIGGGVGGYLYFTSDSYLYKKNFAGGIKAYEQGDYEQAKEYLEKASSYDGNKEVRTAIADNYLAWGNLFTKAGKFEDALAKYKLADMNSESAEEGKDSIRQAIAGNYAAWGDAEAGEEKYEDAERHYLQALEDTYGYRDAAGVQAKMAQNYKSWADSYLNENAPLWAINVLDNGYSKIQSEELAKKRGEIRDKTVIIKKTASTGGGFDAEYDENGLQTDFHSYNADGTLNYLYVRSKEADGTGSAVCESYDSYGNMTYGYETRYDKEGRVVSEKNYRAQGQLSSVSEYVYSESGGLLSSKYVYYQEDGTAYQKSEITYDGNGNYLKEIQTDGDGRITCQSESTYGADGNIAEWNQVQVLEDQSFRTVYFYDAAGNLTESDSYENGVLAYQNVYTYDEEGRQLSDWCYSEDGVTLIYGNEYAYDAAGNQISMKYYSENGAPGMQYEFEYDAAGNQISYKVFDGTGRLSYRYEYIYDEEGHQLSYKNFAADGSLQYGAEMGYDENGYMTSHKYFESGGILSSSYEYIRDAYGNELEYKRFNRYGGLEYYAQYDVFGNVFSDSYGTYNYTYRYIENLDLSDREGGMGMPDGGF